MAVLQGKVFCDENDTEELPENRKIFWEDTDDEGWLDNRSTYLKQSIGNDETSPSASSVSSGTSRTSLSFDELGDRDKSENKSENKWTKTIADARLAAVKHANFCTVISSLDLTPGSRGGICSIFPKFYTEKTK
jgi:hypothetical protein